MDAGIRRVLIVAGVLAVIVHELASGRERHCRFTTLCAMTSIPTATTSLQQNWCGNSQGTA
ncbi:MAG: hypothetical protein EA382_01090 [Spirochaetaceae bacterium]|nr:MAG: hypothetical protein EA382_01090 [Spirochaetaceae bacterium]